MKQRASKARQIEKVVLCVYGAWLLFTICMWNTQWMETEKRSIFGVSLVLATVIYLLISCVRRLPQVRTAPSWMNRHFQMRLLRLRMDWLSQLKLIFVSGLALTSCSMLFSQGVRMVFTILTLLSLLYSVFYFLNASRKIAKSALSSKRKEKTTP